MMERIARFLETFERQQPALFRLAVSNWTLIGLGLVIVITGYFSGLYR